MTCFRVKISVVQLQFQIKFNCIYPKNNMPPYAGLRWSTVVEVALVPLIKVTLVPLF